MSLSATISSVLSSVSSEQARATTAELSLDSLIDGLKTALSSTTNQLTAVQQQTQLNKASLDDHSSFLDSLTSDISSLTADLQVHDLSAYDENNQCFSFICMFLLTHFFFSPLLSRKRSAMLGRLKLSSMAASLRSPSCTALSSPSLFLDKPFSCCSM